MKYFTQFLLISLMHCSCNNLQIKWCWTWKNALHTSDSYNSVCLWSRPTIYSVTIFVLVTLHSTSSESLTFQKNSNLLEHHVFLHVLLLNFRTNKWKRKTIVMVKDVLVFFVVVVTCKEEYWRKFKHTDTYTQAAVSL